MNLAPRRLELVEGMPRALMQQQIVHIKKTLAFEVGDLMAVPIGVAIFVRGFWPVPLTLFVVGWVFQFIGHAVEGKPPEFFQDWRFLLVGLRWWMAKVRGRA